MSPFRMRSLIPFGPLLAELKSVYTAVPDTEVYPWHLAENYNAALHHQCASQECNISCNSYETPVVDRRTMYALSHPVVVIGEDGDKFGREVKTTTLVEDQSISKPTSIQR